MTDETATTPAVEPRTEDGAREPNVEAGDYIEDDPEAWRAWVAVFLQYGEQFAALAKHVGTPHDAAEILAGTMLSVLADRHGLYLTREAATPPADDTLLRLSPEALDTVRVWAITEMGTERGYVAHLPLDRFITQVADFIALNRSRLRAEPEARGPKHEGPHFIGEFDRKPVSRTCPACRAATEPTEEQPR